MEGTPGEQSGLSCLKYLVLGFNSIFMMTGVLMVSIGTTIFGVYYYFNQFLETQFFSPASILTITGGFMFLIAIIGFVAVIKESTLMINTYCILLCFICLLEISAGISAVVFKGRVESTVCTRMNRSLHNYLYDAESQVSVDFTQRTLHCCGVHDVFDWKNIFPTNKFQYEYQDIVLPESCCEDFIQDASEFMCFRTNLSGCLPRLKYVIYQTLRILLGSSLTLAIIQFTGIVFSHKLAKLLIKIKSDREAAEIVMRNHRLNVYNTMRNNCASIYTWDKPPSYDEVTHVPK